MKTDRIIRIGLIFTILFTFGSTSQSAYAKKNADRELLLTRFSVAGMTCGTCANSATKELLKISGVREAKVDFDTKQATVKSDTAVTEAAIREALGRLGFEARFADDTPVEPPLSDEERAQLDIKAASHGEAFKTPEFLAPGKYTIFDFFAEWCGPCHLLTPKLERLVQKRRNIALRKVDIVSWKSDAAKQATKDFKMPGLPYVRVYGPDGKFIGAVSGNHFDKVQALLDTDSSMVTAK